MTFDLWLFNIINGVAGRFHWLDKLGQWFAVFGLLAVLIIVIGMIWYLRIGKDSRKFLSTLLLSAVICFALLAAEWALCKFILHHDLRARPANAHWATLLITERSSMAFPAWPIVIAFALAIPSCRLSRAWGIFASIIGLLTGISLVFVGVNYPFDVITAMAVGSTIGFTASLAFNRQPLGYAGRRLVYFGIVIWLVIAAWGGITFAEAKHELSSNEVPDSAKSTISTGVEVQPPAEIEKALTSIDDKGKITIQAATNRHLLAAWLIVQLPNADISLSEVENMTRSTVNILFQTWKPLDLLTVEIDAIFPQGKIGTLYTATICREDWPTEGFNVNQRLPGKKFYNSGFLKP